MAFTEVAIESALLVSCAIPGDDGPTGTVSLAGIERELGAFGVSAMAMGLGLVPVLGGLALTRVGRTIDA